MYMLKAITQNSTNTDQRHQRGAGLAEYAMLLLLITIITATVVSTLGGRISAIFDETCENLYNAEPDANNCTEDGPADPKTEEPVVVE